MKIPQAKGARSPFWPLPDVTRKRWTFGWGRAKGERHHAGVDLYAPRGSVVLAPESGTLIGSQRFVGPNSVALLLQTDSGMVILFGEVEPGSWRNHGLTDTSRIFAGQPVANVGINPKGDQMLHFETYRSGTTQNHRWYQGKAPPPALLDPTTYLKTAEALDTGQADDGTDVDTGGTNDDDITDDQADDQADDQDPNIMPVDPGDPVGPIAAGPPWLAIGLFLLSNWSRPR